MFPLNVCTNALYPSLLFYRGEQKQANHRFGGFCGMGRDLLFDGKKNTFSWAENKAVLS
jgi:hypothetical protein